MENLGLKHKQSIGALLLESGKLKPEDADKILIEQSTSNIRFGDAAVKLGLVSQSDIDSVISKQFHFSYIKDGNGSVDPHVVVAYEPASKTVEGFRALRGQLGVRWFSEQKSLVVLAAESKVGNSVVCANMAVSFAQLGKKTLIVDANMRHPSIHSLFHIENKTGFSDLLASRSSHNDSIVKFDGLDNLFILPSGPTPPNPVELLGRNELKALVSELESCYDVIIYDVPASIEHSDAQMLLSCIKGVLLVVKKNKSSIANIDQVKRQMKMNGVEIVGSLINEF